MKKLDKNGLMYCNACIGNRGTTTDNMRRSAGDEKGRPWTRTHAVTATAPTRCMMPSSASTPTRASGPAVSAQVAGARVPNAGSAACGGALRNGPHARICKHTTSPFRRWSAPRHGSCAHALRHRRLGPCEVDVRPLRCLETPQPFFRCYIFKIRAGLCDKDYDTGYVTHLQAVRPCLRHVSQTTGFLFPV